MAFSEKLLAKGETVQLELHTHIKRILAPVLVFIVTAVAVGFLLSYAADQGWAQWITWVIVALGLLVFLVWVAKPVAEWWTTKYVITNRRLITRAGLLKKTGRDIPLYRINDVTYEKGVLDRVLGCGTLVVSDATDKAGLELSDVPRVEQVQLRLTELLFDSDDGSDDGEFPPGEPPRRQGAPVAPTRPWDEEPPPPQGRDDLPPRQAPLDQPPGPQQGGPQQPGPGQY